MPTLLETERLLFRDWTEEDFRPFHAICSDPAVMQFVGDGEPWSEARTVNWIATEIKMTQTHGYCRWALIFKETSELIGFCGFIPTPDGPEIGWRLAKRFWGHGLATEAASAALNHRFDTLGFQRVIAQVQSPNRASIRICEKLGMKFDHSFDRDGRTVLVYSISNSD
jgi:ribosomal-protein-alanine N-acetyltransferase